MDGPVREGKLYLQHQKFGKKWKKNWIVLYPASQFGVARLEFFDTKDSSAQTERPNTKRLDRKIMRLAEVISVLPLPTETCPKNNMAAFYVETNDKSYIFAGEKQDSAEWISKLCEVAFPNTPTDPNKMKALDSESSQNKDESSMKMAVNSIYFSREEVTEFWVTVQKTEAAERCGLSGAYSLKADKDGLILKCPQTKQTLYTWPYKLLRRYGRDKVMFSFEAGRRCKSGPGNFTFETKQGNEIFLIVESSIKEQKAQAEDNRQSCSSLDADCPNLIQIRNQIAESMTIGNAALPGTELSADPPKVDVVAPEDAAGRARPGNKLGSTEALFVRKEGKPKNAEDWEAAKMLKSRVLPDPPIPPAKPTTSTTPTLPKTPKNMLGNPEDPTTVYSEPKDSMRFFKPNVDNLYSDPVDSVPGGGAMGGGLIKPHPMPEDGNQGPFYADLYEQVDLTMLNPPAVPKGKFPVRNHIYDEPEGRVRPPAPTPTPSIATRGIYEEASLSQEAWKTQAIDDKLGYEYPYNANTDVYSVPTGQPCNQKPKAKAKGPKPVPAPKPQVVKPPERPGDVGAQGREGLAGKPGWAMHNYNNSNNNNASLDAVYSRVIKLGRAAVAPLVPSSQEAEVSLEHSPAEKNMCIYEDLGKL